MKRENDMRRDEAIWILEDDEGTIFVFEELLGHRYHLTFFSTLSDFSQALQTKKLPHLIIADLKLKDGYFLDFLTTGPTDPLKKTSFLVVSSIDDPDSLRFCFKHGALDYLVKPFKRTELIVKVEKLIDNALELERRKTLSDVQFLQEQILKEKLPLVLETVTGRERMILDVFLASKNYIVSKDELFHQVWGDTSVSSKSLDVHFSHLRKKLQKIEFSLVALENGFLKLQHIG